MIVFRLCRAAYAALDGEGARLYGGRWNSPGRPMLYTAASPSLALIEVMVHLDLTPELLPEGYRLLTIEVPDGATHALNETPILPAECVRIGDAFLERATELVLSVRSVIVPQERNALINVRHADADRMQILADVAFRFDARLIKQT